MKHSQNYTIAISMYYTNGKNVPVHGKKLNKMIIASCKIMKFSGDMCPTIMFKMLSSILQSHVLFMFCTCTTCNLICWSCGTGAHVLIHFATEIGRGQNHWLEKQLWLILNGVVVMRRLSKFERHRAVGMLETGMAHNKIAGRFGVHWNTNQKWWQHYQQQGNTRDRPRSGCPRVTSQAQNNHIPVTHLLNRFQSATLTDRTIPGLRVISARTVRNRLLEHNIRPWHLAIRPILLWRHWNAHLAWSRQHLRFTHCVWSGVLFTDETWFHLDSSDRQNRIMSLIEHLWNKMERRISLLPNQTLTLNNWVVTLFRSGTTSHKGFRTIWYHQWDVIVRPVGTHMVSIHSIDIVNSLSTPPLFMTPDIANDNVRRYFSGLDIDRE